MTSLLHEVQRRRIEEKSRITPETAKFIPGNSLQKHPDLLQGKIIHLSAELDGQEDSNPDSIVAVIVMDGPGSAGVLSHPVHGREGAEMFRDYLASLAWKAQSYGLNVDDTAGDAMGLHGKLNLIDFILFALDCQVEFEVQLKNHPNIEALIATQKHIPKPYIHAGICPLSPETNEELCLAMFDLADRYQIAAFGKGKKATRLATQFITSSPFIKRTSPLQDDPAEISFSSSLPPLPEEIVKQLEDPRVGLKVRFDKDINGNTISTIDVPTDTDVHLAVEELRRLTNQKEPSQPKLPLNNIPHIPGADDATLVKFLPQYMRNGEKWSPDHQKKNESLQSEAIFAYFKGLDDLQQSLIDTLGADPRVMDIYGETARFIAKHFSRTLVDAGCNMKELEFSETGMKAIATVNAVIVFPDHPGYLPSQVLTALKETMGCINDPDFKSKLIDYLKEKAPDISEKFLEELITTTNFYIQAGVSDCAADCITCMINEQQRLIGVGADQIGGSEISAAARFMSAMQGEYFNRVAEPRIAKLAQKSELTPLEQEELEQLKRLPNLLKGNFIVLQKAIAQKLEILDPHDPNQAELKDVRFRGFANVFDLVILKV